MTVQIGSPLSGSGGKFVVQNLNLGATAGTNVTEQYIGNVTVPAGACPKYMYIYAMFRIRINDPSTNQSATCNIRVGTAGTIADSLIATLSQTAHGEFYQGTPLYLIGVLTAGVDYVAGSVNKVGLTAQNNFSNANNLIGASSVVVFGE